MVPREGDRRSLADEKTGLRRRARPGARGREQLRPWHDPRADPARRRAAMESRFHAALPRSSTCPDLLPLCQRVRPTPGLPGPLYPSPMFRERPRLQRCARVQQNCLADRRMAFSAHDREGHAAFSAGCPSRKCSTVERVCRTPQGEGCSHVASLSRRSPPPWSGRRPEISSRPSPVHHHDLRTPGVAASATGPQSSAL